MAIETTPGEMPPNAVTEALSRLADAVAGLVVLVEGGELDRLGVEEVGGFAAEFERVRNVLPLVDHAIVRAVATSGLVELWSAASPRQLLRALLRISGVEASRRVQAAENVGIRFGETGLPLPPRREITARAQCLGELTVEQVRVITSALAPLDQVGYAPEDVTAGERILVDAARAGLGVDDLRGLARHVVDAIDPDGSAPDDDLNEARRYLRLRRAGDGAWMLSGRLTGIAGARLQALLNALSQPVVSQSVLAQSVVPQEDCARAGENDVGPDLDAGPGMTSGPVSRQESGTALGMAAAGTDSGDLRSAEQRRHDALDEACDRLLASGVRPVGGGSPATVIITVDREALNSARQPGGPESATATTGHATTSDGTVLSISTVGELLSRDDTEVFQAGTTTAGAVLDLGRRRRLASRAQRLALIVRDGGCSFPGCDRPPEWCERHHLTAWADGGPTDLDNLTLLCRYHHHQHAQRGWRCRLNAERLPEWIPPPWVDAEQRPILNGRLVSRLLARPSAGQGSRRTHRRPGAGDAA